MTGGGSRGASPIIENPSEKPRGGNETKGELFVCHGVVLRGVLKKEGVWFRGGVEVKGCIWKKRAKNEFWSRGGDNVWCGVTQCSGGGNRRKKLLDGCAVKGLNRVGKEGGGEGMKKSWGKIERTTKHAKAPGEG